MPVHITEITRVPRWQQAAELRAQGLKYSEIAKAMNCALASVSNYLKRAREEPGRQAREARR